MTTSLSRKGASKAVRDALTLLTLDHTLETTIGITYVSKDLQEQAMFVLRHGGGMLIGAWTQPLAAGASFKCPFVAIGCPPPVEDGQDAQRFPFAVAWRDVAELERLSLRRIRLLGAHERFECWRIKEVNLAWRAPPVTIWLQEDEEEDDGDEEDEEDEEEDEEEEEEEDEEDQAKWRRKRRRT
jgi:hypothetical protein